MVSSYAGDVTGDGVINSKDMTRIKKYMSDNSVAIASEVAADVTGDGVVNGKDLTRMKKYMAGAATVATYDEIVDTSSIFTISANTITAYNGSYAGVVIPSTYGGAAVTTIGAGAFANATVLESVTIPSSVTSIRAGAFSGCTALASATMEGTTCWKAGTTLIPADFLTGTSTTAGLLANTYSSVTWEKTEHTYGAWTVTIQPTATTEGKQTRTCADCGATQTQAVPATGGSTSTPMTVTCDVGTPNCYTYDGTTLTFTTINMDTTYIISGEMKGNIVVDVGNTYKFTLEMQGFTLTSDSTNPIMVLTADEFELKAKNGYENYIYDNRAAIDTTDTTLYSAAVYSFRDLEISGKGSLTVVSKNNDGIHTKDDLQVKNLALSVTCKDNALKGNDSVEITAATTTLISSMGDCIKTNNSELSSSGNQKGTVTITGGTHNLYAACDGIDAAFDVIINDATTVLNIYTDKYSPYSEEVTAVSASTY